MYNIIRTLVYTQPILFVVYRIILIKINKKYIYIHITLLMQNANIIECCICDYFRILNFLRKPLTG